MHARGCPIINRTPFGLHSDAAKRVSDTFNLHRVADPYGNIGYWFAAALADGKSDGILYESKDDAIDHQHNNEKWYTYIQIVPATFTECEAEIMLKIARMAYDKDVLRVNRGGDTRHELIRRLGWEDQVALSRGLVTNITYGRN